LTALCVHAQSGTGAKTSDFAIVTLTAKTNADAGLGSKYFCVVKYSDGQEFSLEKVLDLPEKPASAIHRDEMDEPKMKVFDYFYKHGYELMSITDVKSQPIRFYFKRKGL